MSQKTTHVFANHGMPLECDVYDRQDSTADDKPVFLFFHAGGLVGSGRDRLPPWLVQVSPFPRTWIPKQAQHRN
jgi:acetyl esterase/lipase